MSNVTKQTYPSTSGVGALEVITDRNDFDVSIDTDAGQTLYLSRNQVRCLIHQLTDWLT